MDPDIGGMEDLREKEKQTKNENPVGSIL